MVGKQRTQVDVVEVKAMDKGLVAVDPAALARGLEKNGSVRIYGILFDVDKAEIRPESKATLAAIADLLRAQPGLSIFVVGHTDSTGALDHNFKLSAARARAVAAALGRDFGDRRRAPRRPWSGAAGARGAEHDGGRAPAQPARASWWRADARRDQITPLGATRILPVRSPCWAWARAVLISSMG